MMKKTFIFCLCLFTVLLGIYGCTSEKDSQESYEKKNEIYFNHIKMIPSSLEDIELNGEDFEKIEKEELVDYYGINIFPSVPSDLKLSNNQYGIYKNNGQIYYDGNVINYANEDFTKSVNIEVSKEQFIPSDISEVFGDQYQQSVIDGMDICLGQTDDQYYYAEFLYHEVGLRIVADGLSEEEFISVIESLIWLFSVFWGKDKFESESLTFLFLKNMVE